MQKLKEPTQTLRTGQIIQGRILKLYPNNKAQIQLGANKLIAQLETPLEMGERYHFQVQNAEGIIRLRVLGSALKYKAEANLLELFQQIGVKTSKANMAFVSYLLENKTPFDKGQLQSAFALLDGATDKGQAQKLLREMIANRIPLTNTIFQSLSVRLNSSFTERLEALETLLQQNQSIPKNQKNGILEQVHRLNGNGRTPLQLHEIAKSHELFDLMMALRLIDRDLPFIDWGNRVRNSSGGNLPELTQIINMERSQNIIAGKPDFDVLSKNAASILNRFGDSLQINIANNTPLPSDIFNNLKQEVDQKVFHLNPSNKHQLVNAPQQLQYLIDDLKVIANSEKNLHLERFVHQNIKDVFTEQTKNVLQNLGLQYEKVILSGENNPANTLKGLLLPLIQSSDGLIQEQANKFLQFINGLQLQSLDESDKFLQANLLIPGGKLGLKSDVELTFEGKKNDIGEIDPDYCRIVFYLDLENIDKTVIDMQVQKRAISLSILNDNSLGNMANILKPILKEGLENINYHLSSVTFKPLTSQELTSPKNKSAYNNQQTSYQGVDFRI